MTTFDRLCRNWVYGGALAAIPLALLIPLLANYWHLPLLLVFAQLPIYMLHQLEEHDNDNFRRFFNSSIGKGHEVLSPCAVFLINVPGVWGVITLSLYLSVEFSLGFGMIAAYLTVVNAVVHLVQAAALRRYNPGAATAAVVFLPVGVITLYAITSVVSSPLIWHSLGIASAVAIHAAILVYVRWNLSLLVGQKPVRAF